MLRLCSGSRCVPRPSLLPVKTVYWCGTWTPAPSPPGTSPSVATKNSSIRIPSPFTWRVGLGFSLIHHYHFLYLCFKMSHVKSSTISPSGLQAFIWLCSGSVSSRSLSGHFHRLVSERLAAFVGLADGHRNDGIKRQPHPWPFSYNVEYVWLNIS